MIVERDGTIFHPDAKLCPKLIQIDGKPKLYDLTADVGEKKDLSAEKPEVVRETVAAWKEWNSKMVVPLWQPAAAQPLR